MCPLIAAASGFHLCEPEQGANIENPFLREPIPRSAERLGGRGGGGREVAGGAEDLGASGGRERIHTPTLKQDF